MIARLRYSDIRYVDLTFSIYRSCKILCYIGSPGSKLTFTIELAKSNRAACTLKECKAKGDKIGKDTLRWGTYITYGNSEKAGYQWKHW